MQSHNQAFLVASWPKDSMVCAQCNCFVIIPYCIIFLLALSISWLVFHPKVGLILLGIALVITGIVLAVIFKNKGNDNSNDAQKTAEAVKHLAYSLKSIF